MTPYNKVRGKLREKNLRVVDVAKYLEISTNSVSNKLQGKRDFTVQEAIKLCTLCNEPLDIFLP